MKLQQMFNQLKNYNEIQNVLDEREKELSIEWEGITLYQGKSFKEFKTKTKKEYSDELVNAIVNCEYLVYSSNYTSEAEYSEIHFLNKFNEPRNAMIQIWIQ